MTLIKTTRAAVLALAAGSVCSQAALAQTFRSEVLGQTSIVKAEAAASNPETVRLLTGLAKIESDLQLGMLFVKDGLTHPEGSHFTHPRKETLPDLKEGLLAAGIPDFEALFQALEAANKMEDVSVAYSDVLAAVIQARSTLRPSTRDMVLSIVAQAQAVVGEINASGPTEVADYQDAWAMVIVARSQVDLLVRNEDPAVAKAAADMGIALDDVILSMPDPNQTAPVAFDPAPIAAAVAKLETLAGSV